MKNKVFLYGAPGSGKTTLGKSLSAALGVKFVDLDGFIENHASSSVREIFERFGEERFREIESSCLSQVCSREGVEIVSLGGGTLLREDNRSLCERKGVVILLEAPPAAELARRLGVNPSSRPLGNMAEQRSSHYASFQRRVSATFQLADSLVMVGRSIAEPFLGEKLVVDENVKSLYPDMFADAIATVPSGEEHKNLSTIQNLWRGFNSSMISRRDLISAAGGGVTLDLAGFAASTWMRGVDWVNFPTTLLSMVDASTGGKTGCDLPEGKNLIGSFHNPRLVVVDTTFLRTLSDGHMKQGLAEMIKHEIISGEKHITCSKTPSAEEIASSLKVKVDIVVSDPFEKKGARALLNCGHTLAHAVEALSGFAVSHGEAVAIGCVNEAQIALKMGLADRAFVNELEERFAQFGIETSLPPNLDKMMLKNFMLNDKKRDGNEVFFALPCGWGDVRLVKMNPMEIEEW